MVVDEGDPYSALLLNKSINRLKARNLFGKVEKKITQGSSPELKVLEIKVEEKATGELAAGAGIGTDGTSFMFSVKENNWLGRGIGFNTSVDVTAETIRGGISVSNPNYNFTGNTVFASFQLAAADRTSSAGFESSKTSLALGTEFELYENIFLSPSLTVAHEDIEVQSSASSAMKKMDGTFDNIDFTYGIKLDERNQVYQPTAGYITKFVQTLPIVMDSSSLSNQLDFKVYHAISEDIIGTAKFFARSIHGIDKDVRVTKRLYLPQNRLRGFKTSRVGPKDGKDWVGGNYTSAFGIEAQLPNLLPEATRTDISVFLDTGNVWSVDYSDTIGDSSTIRSAIGVAANVFTVIGPLSFTLAQHITKDTYDETETFNFRLGTSF
jgi:outer membrane protein insertion porin family